MKLSIANKCVAWMMLLMLMTLLPISSRAQSLKKPDKIVFIENSWLDALHQAQLKNKYIFVDAYATWCGPCNLLKATTFKNSKTAAFFNDNFINVAIDMEKGDGPALAQQWGIQAYPTLLVFDANGKPVTGTVGYLSANQLVKFGKMALGKPAAE
jgi:thiol:disulfide interchange protein